MKALYIITLCISALQISAVPLEREKLSLLDEINNLFDDIVESSANEATTINYESNTIEQVAETIQIDEQEGGNVVSEENREEETESYEMTTTRDNPVEANLESEDVTDVDVSENLIKSDIEDASGENLDQQEIPDNVSQESLVSDTTYSDNLSNRFVTIDLKSGVNEKSIIDGTEDICDEIAISRQSQSIVSESRSSATEGVTQSSLGTTGYTIPNQEISTTSTPIIKNKSPESSSIGVNGINNLDIGLKNGEAKKWDSTGDSEGEQVNLSGDTWIQPGRIEFGARINNFGTTSSTEVTGAVTSTTIATTPITTTTTPTTATPGSENTSAFRTDEHETVISNSTPEQTPTTSAPNTPSDSSSTSIQATERLDVNNESRFAISAGGITSDSESVSIQNDKAANFAASGLDTFTGFGNRLNKNINNEGLGSLNQGNFATFPGENSTKDLILSSFGKQNFATFGPRNLFTGSLSQSTFGYNGFNGFPQEISSTTLKTDGNNFLNSFSFTPTPAYTTNIINFGTNEFTKPSLVVTNEPSISTYTTGTEGTLEVNPKNQYDIFNGIQTTPSLAITSAPVPRIGEQISLGPGIITPQPRVEFFSKVGDQESKLLIQDQGKIPLAVEIQPPKEESKTETSTQGLVQAVFSGQLSFDNGSERSKPKKGSFFNIQSLGSFNLAAVSRSTVSADKIQQPFKAQPVRPVVTKLVDGKPHFSLALINRYRGANLKIDAVNLGKTGSINRFDDSARTTYVNGFHIHNPGLAKFLRK